jgi:DnaJ-class molecular chaperone
MRMSIQHYRTLGLSPSASEEEVKKAYRKLASVHHPDKGGDTKKFQEIQTAYDAILKQKSSGTSYFSDSSRFTDFEDLRDFFDMGRAAARDDTFAQFNFRMHDDAGRIKNPDVNISVPCSLEDAFAGFTKTVEFTLPAGVEKRLAVTFPAGSTPDIKIRYAGEGMVMTPNRPPGDLYVKIELLPHDIWQLRKNELFAQVKINVWQAMLGGVIQITDIEGTLLDVTIPAGTQDGTQIRLKNRGFIVRGSNQRTNAYILIHVEIPKLDQQDFEKQLNEFYKPRN